MPKEIKQEKVEKSETIEIPVGKYLSSLRDNPWRVSTIVLIIVLLGVIFFNPLGSSSTVSADDAGAQVISFLNSNPQLQDQVSLVSVTKEGSFYQALLSFQGQQVPVYLTLDGKYMLSGQPISLTGEPKNTNENIQPTSQVKVDVSADNDAVLGNKNAPVTIIEFSDYQCPFCGKFWAETFPQLKTNYIDTGKVKFIYRDFPLTSIHPMSQKAAEAAECVREKGGDTAYWKMHDKLFENQATLSLENMKKWAKELGYDISSCLDTGKFTQEVTNDLGDGTEAGVTGTPAFFVNGAKVSGALPYSNFEALIENALKDSEVQ